MNNTHEYDCDSCIENNEDRPVKERLEFLLNMRDRINKKIEELRSGCPHNGGFWIANWSDRPGNVYVSRVCTICRMSVEGITERELVLFNTEVKDRNVN